MDQKKPLRQFWIATPEEEWRRQSFAALVGFEDAYIIDVWIDKAPSLMPDIREALNQSERLLQQGWRRDLRAQRREQIL